MKNRAPASLSCLDVLTSSLFKCIGIAIDTSISYHKTLLIHCIIPRTRVNKTISRLWANGFCFFFQNLTKHLITLLSRVNIETWHTKPSINHGYPLNNCFLWKSNTMKKKHKWVGFCAKWPQSAFNKDTTNTHTHTDSVSVVCYNADSVDWSIKCFTRKLSNRLTRAESKRNSIAKALFVKTLFWL